MRIAFVLAVSLLATGIVNAEAEFDVEAAASYPKI